VKALEAKLAKLEEELAAARQAEAEARERWMRSAAEFENFRRRNLRERAELIRTAGEAVLTKLLDVADALRAARSASAASSGEEALEQLRTGISHIEAKLLGVLESEGVAVIPAEPGGAFDPNVHEALAQVPSADLPEDTIHSVIQSGYVLRGRVLRPSRVAVVAAPPGAAPADESAAAAAGDEGDDEQPVADTGSTGGNGEDAIGAA
jgi:molecular chaperone GrpE